MRLRTFYVKSYRSITEATLEDIGEYCVIVGPNNAGKSNLLRAINVALSIALEGDFQKSRRKRQYTFMYNGEVYNWERDIPRASFENERASTVFKLTFEFSAPEKEEFKREFGIRLSKSLQMKFELFRTRTEYNIIMPGSAKAPMEAKIREIGQFIQKKLDYQYIPCVRSNEFTSEYFTRLLMRELQQLNENDEYQQCIQRIETLQEPLISGLEEKLTSALKAFLPNVKQVKLPDVTSSYGIIPHYLYRSRQIPIDIDDGNMTSIEDKGDGVKSLAAISIVQSLTFEAAKGKSLVLCVEEPEAHLHPDAVHSLRNVLFEIASKAGVQVIISTHSPILVDRDHVSNNVVVYDNHRVSPCQSILDVRSVLGVRNADNLAASKVILVEDQTDDRYIRVLCSQINPGLREKLVSGEIEIVNAHSASKMDYQIRLYNSMMVSSIVILDSDDSGIEACSKLVASKLKLPNEVLTISSKGMKKCEIEDLVDFNVYLGYLKNQYNINVDTNRFKGRRKPWSDRLHDACETCPVQMTDQLESQIKEDIADKVEELGISAISTRDREYVYNLVNTIARFVGEKEIEYVP